MAEKIKKGAVKAYFRMLKIWSALILGIVGVFCSKDGLAQCGVAGAQPEYGVSYIDIITKKAVIHNEWKGISASKGYRDDIYQVIKDNVCFGKEWKKFEIREPFPEVDFNKSIVVEIVKKGNFKGFGLFLKMLSLKKVWVLILPIYW